MHEGKGNQESGIYMDPSKQALIAVKTTGESLYCAEGGQHCRLTLEFNYTFLKYKSTGFHEDGGVGSIRICLPIQTKTIRAESDVTF